VKVEIILAILVLVFGGSGAAFFTRLMSGFVAKCAAKRDERGRQRAELRRMRDEEVNRAIKAWASSYADFRYKTAYEASQMRVRQLETKLRAYERGTPFR
jgi:hypothetical protein